MFESTIDDAAAALLQAASANGATALHVAIDDPEFGDYAQAYGTVAIDGADATLADQFDDTTLPAPFTHGYVTGGCVQELADGDATVEEGTDTIEWNTSFAQGGAMASTIDDLVAWAESMTGNDLLGDDLAAQRLQVAPIGGVNYGLGIFQVGAWFGHEGEASAGRHSLRTTPRAACR
jgi:hypothetical protein